MLFFTTSMPTPRPERLVTWRAVEKPGTKIRFITSRRESPFTDSARGQPAGHRHLADPVLVDAVAVVGHRQLDVVAALDGGERDVAGARLPLPLPHLGRLDGVVDGVADEVHERIGELLDDQLVELHLAAGDLQLDLLLHLAGQLAHHAGELVEDLVEGDHAHLEDAALQLGEPPLQPAAGLVQLGRQHRVDPLGLEPLGQRLQRALHQHQLAHHVHEPVQLADVDAHRLGGGAQRAGVWLGQRLGDRARAPGRRRRAAPARRGVHLGRPRERRSPGRYGAGGRGPAARRRASTATRSTAGVGADLAPPRWCAAPRWPAAARRRWWRGPSCRPRGASRSPRPGP